MTLEEWFTRDWPLNAWTDFRRKSGVIRVYARKHIADPSVMMIANIETVSGAGTIRSLYRDYTRDIPTIAEQIINPDLDKLLERWGWVVASRDLIGIPTRVNQAFVDRFPYYQDGATAAILRARDNADRPSPRLVC